MEAKNSDIVTEFLKALSDGKSGDELKQFYDEEVVQTEYPNLLTGKTIARNLVEILEASVRGKQVITGQNYEITKSYAVDDNVIIEAIWTGVLAIPLGKLAAGDEMKAYFSQIYEFKNGKIIKQRNYDCFEKFV
ncbi:MAG: nuclear transport factor 2 family protein [Dehalococcoidales bacterium]